ncbi:inositol-1,3,4-trisphosphate 5/6-kinase [Salvia divinorum]|uniref:Inositol-1,3,4-trisphosphate 5/6-kinase n=1 Tax=Salvia divinorum TaxID=28513 RepID=A0ABD1GLM7_SALDI
MNRREAGEGFQKVIGISNCFKDRDEELSFFRDLKKREKDQYASLLHPISDEFEANGSFGLSRMNSGGRQQGPGTEFLGGETGKNDYNWLKTPPATPLFPSLEMETNGPELVMQREIPIIQPLSRFAGTLEGNNIPTSLKFKPPQRHKTPVERPSISPFIDKRNMKIAPLVSHKPSMTCTDKMKVKSTFPIESRPNFPHSNTSRSTRVDPHSNARSLVPGVSNETPPNLRTTNRPLSATRGRLAYQDLPGPNMSTSTKIIRRQSCSPSVTRGRKPESDGNASNQSDGGGGSGGNRVQIVGSKMVDRLMNARMSNAEDQRSKIKLNGSMNESSGLGRLMTKNSLDMPLKHMEIQRDS